MKLKFKETCMDKNTKAYYYANKTYEFEEQRGLEIIATGKAVEVENEPIEEIKQEAVEDNQTVEDKNTEDFMKALEIKCSGVPVNLAELSKDELVKLAKKVGVAVRGSKEDIIERILAKECPVK